MSTFKEDVEDFVGRLEYKDWTFTITGIGTYLASLYIGPPGHAVKNSYGEREWLQKFFAPVTLQREQDECQWVQAVHVAILALEDHEIFEWFKLDGRAAINPHPATTDKDRPYSRWADYSHRLMSLRELEGK